MRRAAALLAGLAAAAVPAAALALPSDGVEETPGTPPGAVEVTTPQVPQKGKVGFCVHGFRVALSGGGSVGQQFMVKLDDHGSYGIGPFTPDAGGELCGEVSTNPADYAKAKGGPDDKVPPDLCDPSKTHLLRFLSGPWAYDKNGDTASLRSLHADFRVTGQCGDPAPADTGTTTAPAPTSGTGAPASPAPGGAGTPAAKRVLARPASTRLAVAGGVATLTLRGGSSVDRGTLTLRTRDRVRTAPGTARRIVTLATRTYRAAAGRRTVLRLRLTAAGRALLRTHSRLRGRLTLRPSGAKAAATSVVVRPAKGARR